MFHVAISYPPPKKLPANKHPKYELFFINSLLYVTSHLMSSSMSPDPPASSSPAVSSIFTVPNVKLQTESGDSIQVCARRNSHGKASSGSKHWPEAGSCTRAPDRYVLIPTVRSLTDTLRSKKMEVWRSCIVKWLGGTWLLQVLHLVFSFSFKGFKSSVVVAEVNCTVLQPVAQQQR